jgi:hypothetical protein
VPNCRSLQRESQVCFPFLLFFCISNVGRFFAFLSSVGSASFCFNVQLESFSKFEEDMKPVALSSISILCDFMEMFHCLLSVHHTRSVAVEGQYAKVPFFFRCIHCVLFLWKIKRGLHNHALCLCRSNTVHDKFGL